MLKVTAVCEDIEGCPLYGKGSKLDFTPTPPTVAGLDGLPVCGVAVDPLQKAVALIAQGVPTSDFSRTYCGGCPAGKAWWSFQPIVKETDSALSPAATQYILKSIAKMKIFGGIHTTKLMRIVKLIRGTRVPSGRAIVMRGKPGEAFFIVLEGNCEVVQEDEKGNVGVLAVLPPGECFGEMALITGEPASATVRAKDDATVLVVSRENFYAMLGIAPEIAITLARVLANRLANTSRSVLEELKKGMKGRLDLISPAELIQAMNVNNQTGMLVVEQADKSLTIYMHDGQIHEVKMGEKSGEEAFYEFLSWARGQFHFEPVRKEQPQKQVQMDTVGLLLEGMRRVDEFKQTGVWKKS